MKAVTLKVIVKMASAQVFITEQSYTNIWALRARRLIIGCCVDQSRQRVHHSRAKKSLGGSKKKNR